MLRSLLNSVLCGQKIGERFLARVKNRCDTFLLIEMAAKSSINFRHSIERMLNRDVVH